MYYSTTLFIYNIMNSQVIVYFINVMRHKNNISGIQVYFYFLLAKVTEEFHQGCKRQRSPEDRAMPIINQ